VFGSGNGAKQEVEVAPTVYRSGHDKITLVVSFLLSNASVRNKAEFPSCFMDAHLNRDNVSLAVDGKTYGPDSFSYSGFPDYDEYREGGWKWPRALELICTFGLGDASAFRSRIQVSLGTEDLRFVLPDGMIGVKGAKKANDGMAMNPAFAIDPSRVGDGDGTSPTVSGSFNWRRVWFAGWSARDHASARMMGLSFVNDPFLSICEVVLSPPMAPDASSRTGLVAEGGHGGGDAGHWVGGDALHSPRVELRVSDLEGGWVAWPETSVALIRDGTARQHTFKFRREQAERWTHKTVAVTVDREEYLLSIPSSLCSSLFGGHRTPDHRLEQGRRQFDPE
jgi:hypothetical protein